MADKNRKPFKKAYLEITNVCNLNCNFCPKTNRPAGWIDKAQFIHLIEQVKPMTDYVYFHIMGEPLLHPLLPEFLEICHRENLKVSLTTNGTLLKSRQDTLLSSPALYRVSISVHSFEANRTGQTLQEYLSDILEFCKAASDIGKTYVVLRLWNKPCRSVGMSSFRFLISTHFLGNCRKICMARPCCRAILSTGILSRSARSVWDFVRRHCGSLLFGLGGQH